MKPWERWAFRLALAAALITGLLYGWARFFGERLGEFGPEPHPWQGTLQHLHVVVVPALVFCCGMLVRAHALPALGEGSPRRRVSGLALLGVMAPMILSGYLQQTSVDPLWHSLWRWTHIVSSGVFSLMAVMHLFLGKTARSEMN